MILILVGFACLVVAGFLTYVPLGWFALGVCLLTVGYVMRAIVSVTPGGD